MYFMHVFLNMGATWSQEAKKFVLMNEAIKSSWAATKHIKSYLSKNDDNILQFESFYRKHLWVIAARYWNFT